MGRFAASLLALALCLAIAVSLASCGGQDARLLPGQTARDITANLDTVRSLADEGDCVGAESAAEQVSEQVEDLQGVDAKLKRALAEGAERLNEVVAQCEESSSEAIAPAVTAPSEEEETTEREKAAKETEKEAKEAEKELEAAEKEKEKSEGGNPALPPQAKGEGKGLEESGAEEESEEGGEESPSGGLSPRSPAGGEG